MLSTCGCGAVEQTWNSTPDPAVVKATPPADSSKTARAPAGEQVVRVSRGVSLFLSKVSVFDENDERIGGFEQKLFSIGSAFRVLGPDANPMCELKGKFTGWDFRFMKDNVELAHVTKKWAGLGKELFTSADNYALELSDDVPPDNPIRQLIMAAVMCIDMVLKE